MVALRVVGAPAEPDVRGVADEHRVGRLHHHRVMGGDHGDTAVPVRRRHEQLHEVSGAFTVDRGRRLVDEQHLRGGRPLPARPAQHPEVVAYRLGA